MISATLIECRMTFGYKLFLMKNLLFVLVSGVSSFAYAQTRTPSCIVYFIDGIRVNNISSPADLSCQVPLIPAFDHIKTITAVVKLPQRNINSIAGTIAGVDSRAGETPYIRGARPDGTAYYIDGMRLRFLCGDDLFVSMLK